MDGDVERLDEILNRRSGLVGLTGTSDMRAIERRAADGDESCRLAISMYAHRLRRYIGAYGRGPGRRSRTFRRTDREDACEEARGGAGIRRRDAMFLLRCTST
jgi:hypothetical protein